MDDDDARETATLLVIAERWIHDCSMEIGEARVEQLIRLSNIIRPMARRSPEWGELVAHLVRLHAAIVLQTSGVANAMPRSDVTERLGRMLIDIAEVTIGAAQDLLDLPDQVPN